MTTDRGRLNALTSLIQLQEPGGFALPDEVLTAAALPGRIAVLPLPEVPAYTVEQAADAVVADLADGHDVDLAAHATRLVGLSAGQDERHHAQAIVRNAHEQAQSVAVNTAADWTERIITDTLRPAFEHVLELTERHAATLHGHALTTRREVMTASTKVRTAWLEVEALADRYRTLRQARQLADRAGARTLEHDVREEFATFQHPHVLTGHKPGSTGQPPRVEYPADPVDLMRWLVTTAKPAEPWLPTVAEQDAAWWAVYGDNVTRQRRSASNARALAARGDFAVGTPAA